MPDGPQPPGPCSSSRTSARAARPRWWWPASSATPSTGCSSKAAALPTPAPLPVTPHCANGSGPRRSRCTGGSPAWPTPAASRRSPGRETSVRRPGRWPGSSPPPGADATRASYSWHVARTSLPAAYQRLLDAGNADRLSAIFVGSAWLPRHVVLVVDATVRGTLHVYDPARGQVSELRRLAFLRGEIDIAGWDVAWFVVTPDL